MKSLSEAARRLVQNLEHSGRQLRGTMEIRKLMRYQTHAGRIRRGVPIFLTFSPDEKHNILMLRLHRARENDPVYAVDTANLQYGRREQPSLDTEYASFSVERLMDMLPPYDERRAILARNPLASVDGFWLTVRLVCEFVLGLRVCPNCPHCNHTLASENDGYLSCCQDLFGNNCYSDGGGFGRASGISLSVESQKSAGALHSHAQVQVQCLHQHLPLAEVMSKLAAAAAAAPLCYPGNFSALYPDADTHESNASAAEYCQLCLPHDQQDDIFPTSANANAKAIIAEYCRYKSHVCREEYEDLIAWRARQVATQEAWPEYEQSLELVSKRAYLSDGNMDDQQWRNTYLREHVQRVHELKQNHVHLPNKKGDLVPLAHCQRKDNPQKCKSDFPRGLLKRAVVLCRGLLQQLGLPICGRKNRVGSLGGPRNEAMINGTHSLLSAMPFSQTNSDVQLPYRFPTTGDSHADDLCSSQCALAGNFKEVVHAMQSQQDAQIGYSCDYQNKRAAKSCNEVKESMKGHESVIP